MKRKIWIDCDAGTDDAVALMMAFDQRDIDIIGISTSGGNVPLASVVQNVLYIRELYDHSAPVYIGAAQPIQRILGTADFIHGKDGLGDIGLPLSGRVANEGSAVTELVRALNHHDGALEVVCLGPLTNIALSMQDHPHILNKAHHLWVMGGLVDLPGNVTPRAEYNIWADPEAADIVLSSGARISMIGWDTTLSSASLSLEELAQIRNIGTPLAILVCDMQGVRIEWMKATGEEHAINLADALAMAVVLDQQIVTEQFDCSMKVNGGADDHPDRGFIEVTKGEQINYIRQVDRDQYITALCAPLRQKAI